MARADQGAGSAVLGDDQRSALLARLRREPSLRAWMLTAPTGALASLGLTLDDTEIVTLLEQVEMMEDRPLPVTAEDIMTRDPITLAPDATVHDAAGLMADKRISGLPVVDDDRKVVGILSEFDLIARSGATVGDVMTRQVTNVRVSATVDQVRAVFVANRLKRAPVLDQQGKLVGIISRADLVRELAYRWVCERCGNLVRARRAPEGCARCGASNSFSAAPPPAALKACPTCGRTMEG